MGGKSGKPTIGYWYDMDILATACLKIDEVVEFKFADRSAWLGSVTETGTISIYKENLFGGAEREGGVFGQVDIMMGGVDQPLNEFLGSSMRLSGISGPVPAYRNSVNFFFRGVTQLDSEFAPSGVFVTAPEDPPLINDTGFFGLKPMPQPKAFRWAAMNPYFKTFKVRMRRHTKDWHPEIAKIVSARSPADVSPEYHTVFDYKILNYIIDTSSPEAIAAIVIPTSGYTTGGEVPFGRAGTGGSLIPVHPIETPWIYNTSLWLRRTIYSNGGNISFEGYIENAAAFFIDGVLVYSVNLDNDQEATASGVYFNTSIHVAEGLHTLHILALDEEDGSGSDPVVQDNTYFYCVVGAFMAQDWHEAMNPAHIIRECLTDTEWGLGWPTSDIDDSSFYEAAQTLYDERFGLSFKWSQQMTIEDFVMMVLRHINAVVRQDRQTGKFKLTLIRDDYDVDDLIELNPFNSNLESLGRSAAGEMVNIINLTYSKFDGGSDTITVHDLASIETQGPISQDVEMLGIHTPTLAARVAQRELGSRVKPIAKIKISTNRIGVQLYEGGLFKLNWPDQGVSAMICRIVDIDLGQLNDNKITINAVQDVFGLPATSYITPQVTSWIDPTQPPKVAPFRGITETPYYDIARSMSESDLAYLDGTDCYIDVFATEPSSDALDYNLWSASGSAALVNRATGTHAVFTTLTASATKEESSVLHLANAREIIYAIETENAYLVIDNEYAKITDYDEGASTITVDRAVLDTTLAEHAIGTTVLLVDSSAGHDDISYLPAEVVSVKIQTRTPRGVLPIESAPVNTYTMNQRQARPYPPGRVRVNGEIYPSTIGALDGMSLTWAHRNRLTQTAAMVPQSSTSVTPEVGTTYTLRIYNQEMSLLRTETGLTGTAFDYTTALEGEDIGSGSVAVDEFWPKVSLLLNMNGTNSSTVFIDSSPNFAAVFGNTQISTAQFKYGGAAGLFDGSGDYLSFADSENWNFGAGDVVIEGWIRPTTTATAREIIAQRSTADNNNFWLLRVTSSAKIQLTAVSGGSTITNITSNGTVAANTWSHVAAVRSSGTWKIWINGVNSDAVSTNSTSAWPNVGYPLLIGAGDEISNYFSGYIDDLRITKGAARYTSAFTPPNQLGELVKPADFGACTALLNFELMTAAETSSEALQSGDYAKNYADIPPFWSLTLYGEVGDFAGTTIDDTDSKFGSSCGLGVYLRARDEFGLALPGDGSSPVGSMTWDAWIKIPSSFSATGHVHEIFSYYGLWTLGVQTLGSHWFDVDGGLGGGGVSHPSIAESTTTDVWVHYAVTMTQTLIVPAPGSGSLVENVCKLYRNGVLFLTTTAQVPVASACRAYDFNVSATFKIDELRIRRGLHYTGNFTPESSPVLTVDPYFANTVLLMPFNNEYGTTAFENIAPITKTLTAHGNAQISTAQFKYGIAAGLFDGTGDYLSTTHNILHSIQSGDFTIEAWVYRNVSGALHYIVSKRPSGATATGWEWRINSTDLLQFLHVGGSSLVSTTTVPAGQWVHIATVRNGTTVTHYIDGVASGSTTFTNGTENTADTLKVGIGSDLSGSFNGYIDDVRITKGASRYTADFAPPNAELGKYIAVPGDLSTSLTFELESVRDGLVSWQKHRHTVTRA